MINEAMLWLKDWKWIAGIAAGFILIGFILTVMILVVVGVSLVAASGSSSDKPSATSGKNSKRASREPEAPRGSLAPELAGTWYHSAGGGETDYTGKSRYRSNRRQMYRVTADGAVKYTFERETLTIMQCEIKERKTASGKAATDGDSLTINFGAADWSGSNSCEGGETEEKTLPAETVRLNWRFKEEFGATRLCFDEADGEACYDRKD